MQTEVKLRQVTQTTLRDIKGQLKEKISEIEVLKEMVKSANMQTKAKDIDVQRLVKKVSRLEKMSDIRKQYPAQFQSPQPDGDPSSLLKLQQPSDSYMEADTFNFQMPPDQADQTNQRRIEDEVEKELLREQEYPRNKSRPNKRQDELSEILEEQQRQQSIEVFRKKYDRNFDEYQKQLSIPNFKNNSSSIRGVMSFGDNIEDSYHLPRLNVSKRDCKY